MIWKFPRMSLFLRDPLGHLECIEVASEAILGVYYKPPTPYSSSAWGMGARKSHQTNAMSRTAGNTFNLLVGPNVANLSRPVFDTSMGESTTPRTTHAKRMVALRFKVADLGRHGSEVTNPWRPRYRRSCWSPTVC